MHKRNIFVGIFLVLVVVFSLVAKTEASFFSDVWDSIKKPFSGSDQKAQDGNQENLVKENESKEEKEAPLYKPVLDYENAVIAAVEKSMPAVVSITVSKLVPILENCRVNPFGDLPGGFGDFFGDDFFFSQPCDTGKKELQEVGGGSGFIVSSDGLIVTNKHVAADIKASYTAVLSDGRKFEAKVLARDPVQDLAIVKIDAKNLPTIELGDSNTLKLGQTVIAIGNALSEFSNTVSVGVVSGLGRNVTASGGGMTERISGVIQTDAAINPGNSGGPLLNLKGQVIGINTAVATGAENIGFAIPINKAKKDISSVKATGGIQTPYIGVRYILVTSELAKSQKLSIEEGALVRGTEDGPAVEPGSPAEKAGILAEDIIISVNGKKITKDSPLGEIIAEYNVGQKVNLKVMRSGKEISLELILGQRPAN